jgi:hypothetical protein
VPRGVTLVATAQTARKWGCPSTVQPLFQGAEIMTRIDRRLRTIVWLSTFVIAAVSSLFSQARAQVPLSTYMDANGYVDVQALTCAQLANTFQEDADYLAAWYSGWYNGLGKHHMAKISRAKSNEHEVIVYCKQHPELKVIQAIDVIFKSQAR